MGKNASQLEHYGTVVKQIVRCMLTLSKISRVHCPRSLGCVGGYFLTGPIFQIPRQHTEFFDNPSPSIE